MSALFEEDVKIEQSKEKIYRAMGNKIALLFARFSCFTGDDEEKEINGWIKIFVRLIDELEILTHFIDKEIKSLEPFKNDGFAKNLIADLIEEKRAITLMLNSRNNLLAFKNTKKFTSAHLETIANIVKLITHQLGTLEKNSRNAQMSFMVLRNKSGTQKAA